MMILVGKLNKWDSFLGFFKNKDDLTESPTYAVHFDSVKLAKDFAKETRLLGHENVRVFEIYVHEIGD